MSICVCGGKPDHLSQDHASPAPATEERIAIQEHELPAYFTEVGTADAVYSVGRVRLLSCVLCGAVVPHDWQLHAANQHVRWHAELHAELDEATPPDTGKGGR